MYNIISKNEFDISYVNENAEVVVVGISPGPTQNANYDKARNKKDNNRKCAFSGEPMRTNIIKMLDTIHVNKVLGIPSCQSFWSVDFDKVCLTSILKSSVKQGDKFISSINYGQIQKNANIKELFDEFVLDCKSYRKAKLFVACGPRVKEILDRLVEEKHIKVPVIAIAHPSGANSGRISAYMHKAHSNHEKSFENAIIMRKEADLEITHLLENLRKSR